jgi:hypothetical protein
LPDVGHLVLDLRFFGVALGGVEAAVGDRRHEVGVDRMLLRELDAELVADVLDDVAVDAAVGPREVDVLEDAVGRVDLLLRDEALGAGPFLSMKTISPGSMSRWYSMPWRSKAQVSDATAQELPFLPSTSGRKPCGSRTAIISVGREEEQREAALDLGHRLLEALLEVGRAGDQVEDDFGVGGRVEDREEVALGLDLLRSVCEFTRLPLWATAIIEREDVTTSGWALAGLEAPVVE